MPTQSTFVISDVEKKLGMVAGGIRKGLTAAIAEWLRHTIIQAFNEQRSPEGAAWKTLSAGYGAAKQAATGTRAFRLAGRAGTFKKVRGATVLVGATPTSIGGRKKLYRSGTLQQQVIRSVAISGNLITAGSTLPYAAPHQFGATIQIPEIRPKKSGGVLRWFGSGGAIFARRARAHKVVIPARPFLPSPAFAEKEGAMVVDEFVQAQIDGAGAGK
jgi:phage gpG-like protein